MKFVIFIGQHKVGSTSLQMSLAHNFARLIKSGILYPTIHNPNLTRDFKAFAARRFGVGPIPMAIWEAHNALAHQMVQEVAGLPVPPWHPNLPSVAEIFANINAQIKRHDPETVVICSETMSTFGGLDRRLIECLEDFTKGHEVQILCTLRRPDTYIASWHGQEMKGGAKLAALREEGLLAYLDTVHIDYKLMIDAWRDVFKGADFSFVNYADVMKRGGSIPDFWHRTGLSEPAGMNEPRHTNPSIPMAALEIARIGNHQLAPTAANTLVRWLIRNSDNLGVANNQVEILGRTNRDILVERFQRVSDYLDEIDAPFFPDLEDIATLRAIPELEAVAQALPRLRELAHLKPPHKDIPAFLDGCLDTGIIG